MQAQQATPPTRDAALQEDHRVVLHGVPWEVYEQLVQARGESAVPRISYCEGVLELMSPSTHHERIKTMLARLLELYALARGIDLYGIGSWTLRKKLEQRGLEPDECYSLGIELPEVRPDLAIEVVWTSGGIRKLDIYRKLEVPEVWIWQDGTIAVHGLRGAQYIELPRSELLPGFDIEHALPYLTRTDQPVAIREYWAWLQQQSAQSPG
ncbi:MAG: Uma2 family endonuclease [Myxococcota bacterium]